LPNDSDQREQHVFSLGSARVQVLFSWTLRRCFHRLFATTLMEMLPMKSPLKVLAVGTTLAVASLSVHAQDNFVGLTWGETSNNIQRSNSLKAVPEPSGLDGTINNSPTWGIRGGQQTEAGRMYVTYENISDT